MRTFGTTFSLAALTTVLLAISPARAAELHRYLPADTELVISLNLKQILGTKLVKNHALEPLKALLADSPEATAALKELGLDPLSQIHRILIASPGSKEPDRGLVIIQGEFDPVKFKDKGAALLRQQPNVVKVHKITDAQGAEESIFELALLGQNFPWFIAVPGKDAILLSPGKDYIVDALKRNPIKNPLALKSKEFQSLLENLDDKQSVYLAATAGALGRLGLPESVAGDLLNKMDGLAGGIRLEDDLHLEIIIGAKTVAEARSLRQTVDTLHTQGLLILGLLAAQDPGVGTAVDILKSMRFIQKDKTVTVKARLEADLIQSWLNAGK